MNVGRIRSILPTFFYTAAQISRCVWMVNSIFRKLGSMSFRSRMMIGIIICVVLPWIMTYFVSDYYTRDVLEQRAVQQSEQTLRTIEMSIKQSFDNLMYISTFIQFDAEFRQLLKSYRLIDQGSEHAEQEIVLHKLRIQRYLEGITNIIRSTYITILTDNELYYTNYPTYNFNPLQFYQEPWIDQLNLLNNYETFWLGAHPNYVQDTAAHSPYLITMGKTVKQLGAIQAYVIISSLESEFSQKLKNFAEQNDHLFYLTDEDGVILSSVHTEDIGTKLPHQISQIDRYQVVKHQGKDHLLVSQPVSYSNWRLISLVPYKETIGNINRMTSITIIIQGAFLAFFMLVLIVLVRQITKPIVRLIQVTREVERGNLSRRAQIKGKHDLALLGHSLDRMLDRIEDMIEQIKYKEEAKRIAEFEMLQAQINPHFLFNVLNAIRLNLKMKGEHDSSDLIQSLASLLRMTINRNNPFISLQEELQTIEHYVKLMNFRHDQRIRLQLNIAFNALSERVPRFFLQPIIENAIIHGFADMPGHITISAEITSDHFLVITVTDDGCGMDAETLAKLQDWIFTEAAAGNSSSHQSLTGVGIRNVYQRMRITYGERFDMILESRLSAGTTYTFYIPKE
jgi:two-component system sensor histidine kinase YesM